MALAGCGAGSAYRDGPGFMAGAISPKSTWTAEGDVVPPEAAIDGKTATAATTRRAYVGHVVTIDLKKVCLFQAVIIDHGRREMGFAHTVELSVSTGGREFQSVCMAPGTRRVTIISLPRPVLARYVRLRATRPSLRPWSLAEIYLQ